MEPLSGILAGGYFTLARELSRMKQVAQSLDLAALQEIVGLDLGTNLVSGLTSMTRQSKNNLRNNNCSLMAFRSIQERA